jgi:hypothetical protein
MLTRLRMSVEAKIYVCVAVMFVVVSEVKVSKV